MNLPLNGHIICNDTFQGPGGVVFDFKEYCFEPTFHTYDNSQGSFARVLDAIKRLNLMEIGLYKCHPKHYGPIVIDQIEVFDFIQIDSNDLTQEIDNQVNNIDEQYFTKDKRTIDREFIKDKIHYSLRLVPIDTSIFFKYNVQIEATNIKSSKIIEQNLFCYFHSLIGYNQDKFYLLTLFYE